MFKSIVIVMLIIFILFSCRKEKPCTNVAARGTVDYLSTTEKFDFTAEQAFQKLNKHDPIKAGRFNYHLVIVGNEYLFTLRNKTSFSISHGFFVNGNTGEIRFSDRIENISFSSSKNKSIKANPKNGIFF